MTGRRRTTWAPRPGPALFLGLYPFRGCPAAQVVPPFLEGTGLCLLARPGPPWAQRPGGWAQQQWGQQVLGVDVQQLWCQVHLSAPGHREGGFCCLGPLCKSCGAKSTWGSWREGRACLPVTFGTFIQGWDAAPCCLLSQELSNPEQMQRLWLCVALPRILRSDRALAPSGTTGVEEQGGGLSTHGCRDSACCQGGSGHGPAPLLPRDSTPPLEGPFLLPVRNSPPCPGLG